jgi:hypothetical protein
MGKKEFNLNLDECGPGFQAFAKASGRYSSNVYAMAASIALYCRENGHDPMVIGREFYEDEKGVKDMRELAKYIHGQARNKHAPKPPGLELTMGLINSGFSIAGVLMKLETETIEGFQALYDDLKLNGDSFRNMRLRLLRAETNETGVDLLMRYNYPQIAPVPVDARTAARW